MSKDILLIDGAKYKYWQPKDEINQFEPIILQHIQDIFGDHALFFEKKKIKTSTGVGSIPDGFVIALDGKPTCFVVEIELSEHDEYRHGINQMQRIERAIANYQTHNEIIKSIFNEVKGTEKEILIKKMTKETEIHKFLSDIISSERIKTVIIIDNATDKWKDAFDGQNHKLIEFKTYARINSLGNYISPMELHAHLFEPVIQIEKEKSLDKTPSIERTIIRSHYKEIDTVVCPAREEGFRRVFIEEDRWHEIRISKLKIPKIKYIAMYEVAPVSAIRWIASVREIKPYKDTGKYQLLLFDKKQINPIRLTPEEGKKHVAPQGPWYSTIEKIRKAKKISDTF